MSNPIEEEGKKKMRTRRKRRWRRRRKMKMRRRERWVRSRRCNYAVTWTILYEEDVVMRQFEQS